jgi:hypothetical protein
MKVLKNLTCLLLIAIVIVSCNENDEALEFQNELQHELSRFNKAVATYQDKTLVLKNENDLIMKFIGNELDYQFTYSGNTNAKLSDDFGKNDSEEITIENSETDEFITISNITLIDDNTARFDALTSSGVILSSIVINHENILYITNNNTSRACPPCVFGVVVLIAEVVIELADDDLDSNCNAAINACADNGGVPSVQLDEGWFSSSCTVTCNIPE